jgi:hypothetical protein
MTMLVEFNTKLVHGKGLSYKGTCRALFHHTRFLYNHSPYQSYFHLYIIICLVSPPKEQLDLGDEEPVAFSAMSQLSPRLGHSR